MKESKLAIRCRGCDKPLRAFNQSGMCSNCRACGKPKKEKKYDTEKNL